MYHLQGIAVLLTYVAAYATAAPFQGQKQHSLSCKGERVEASNGDVYCRVFLGQGVSNSMSHMRFRLSSKGDGLHVQGVVPFTAFDQHIQDCADAVSRGSTTAAPIQSFQVYNDGGRTYCAFSPSLNCDLDFHPDDKVAGGIYQYNLIGTSCT